MTSLSTLAAVRQRAFTIVELLAATAVKASTVPEIEEAWQQGMITNKRWLAKFVPDEVKAAAA